MSKAIAIFVGGITDLRQIAIREDGAVFRRSQFRDPRYGLRWSKWKATGAKLGPNAAAALPTIEDGFATLHRATPDDPCINNRALFDRGGNIRVRLP